VEERDRPELGKILHEVLLEESDESDHVDLFLTEETLIDGSFNLQRVAERFLRAAESAASQR